MKFRWALSLSLWLLAAQPAIASDIYDYYYQHGLAHYRYYVAEAQAKKMAATYAKEFADYYASIAYQQALQTALPAASTPALTQAAKQSPRAIRDLQLAAVGYDLIKHFEGLRLKPYRDVSGKMTIGYGHLLRPREAYQQITQTKAEELLRREVAIAELLVKQFVKVPLSLSQFSALVALVYNIGGGQFAKSTLLTLINQQQYTAAAEEILRWEYAGGKVLRGLERRRHAEYLLFTGKWQK
jgi:lysozyme